nr:hypothetical protein Itr_chr12CG16040 [Ipomoea trifida]
MTVMVYESPLEVKPISDEPILSYHTMQDIDEYRDNEAEVEHRIEKGCSLINDDDLQLVETPLLEDHTRDWHNSIRKLNFKSSRRPQENEEDILASLFVRMGEAQEKICEKIGATLDDQGLLAIDHHVYIKNNLHKLPNHQRKLLAKVDKAKSHLQNSLTETLTTLIKCMKEDMVLSKKMQQERHVQQVKLIQSQETRINKMENELA